MKNLQTNFVEVLAGFMNDYGVEAVFEELFPNQNIEDVFFDMYNSGMIPDDVMEKFLDD